MILNKFSQVETLSVEADGAWARKNHHKLHKIEYIVYKKFWNPDDKYEQATVKKPK